MNFREIVDALLTGDLMNEALDEFLSMLVDVRWMFDRSASALWVDSDFEAEQKAVHERDIEVNRAERGIRRRIVRHLAINPSPRTNEALVLMSVVKDAERLGDYCKNIIDVRRYRGQEPVGTEPLVASLKELQRDIDLVLGSTADIFRDSDADGAKQVLKAVAEITKRCEALIDGVLAEDQLTNRQAVCVTLTARYFRRVAAHAGNIATAVVMPLHKLDFFDEKRPGATPG